MCQFQTRFTIMRADNDAASVKIFSANSRRPDPFLKFASPRACDVARSQYRDIPRFTGLVVNDRELRIAAIDVLGGFIDRVGKWLG